MKLYTAKAPNPNRVNIFLAEKEIDIPTIWLDVMKGETRTEAHFARNSLGETPVLELDDGTYITESFAICRYLESLYPEYPLMGKNPLHTAKVEMWARRIEQQICLPVGDFALHTFPIFAEKVEQNQEYAEACLRLLKRRWEWLDKELSDGRTFIVDDELSFADIAGSTALMISGFLELPIPDKLNHAKRWAEAVQTLKGW